MDEFWLGTFVGSLVFGWIGYALGRRDGRLLWESRTTFGDPADQDRKD